MRLTYTIERQMFAVKLGQLIRKHRLKKKKSQSEVARFVSLTYCQMSRIERGKAQISAIELFRVCAFLDVSPDEILYEMKNFGVN